jgi:flagellar hook-length control protein FliK
VALDVQTAQTAGTNTQGTVGTQTDAGKPGTAGQADASAHAAGKTTAAGPTAGLGPAALQNGENGAANNAGASANNSAGGDANQAAFRSLVAKADAAAKGAAGKNTGPALHNTTVNAAQNNNGAQQAPLVINVNLNTPAGLSHTAAGSAAHSTAQTGAAITQALAQELNGALGTNIVQNASMVLRDGGAGLIRLNLKPETLGAVKVKLEMADNKVTGTITVQSEEAYKAFQQQVHGLEQSFRDQGFDNAQLNVTVGGQNARGADAGQGNGGQGSGQYFSPRLMEDAAGRYEGGPEGGRVFAGAGWGNGKVSLLA